jgi:hypothetical protein
MVTSRQLLSFCQQPEGNFQIACRAIMHHVPARLLGFVKSSCGRVERRGEHVARPEEPDFN